MELRSEFGLWIERILTPVSEFLMDQINLWWIRTTTTQKFLKISLKNKRYNWMWRILHADQRQNQNHKEGNLLAIHQGSFRWTQGIGLILNQGNILSLCVRSFEESNSSSSSFSAKYIEKRMERFISGEIKKIFRINSHSLFIGLTIDGKHAWQQEEEPKRDSRIVLILQEQLFISELFRDIQDAILLILHYRTMW